MFEYIYIYITLLRWIADEELFFLYRKEVDFFHTSQSIKIIYELVAS